MAQPLAAPFSYFADANGLPLSGGKIYTYAAGTTTPQNSYTDSTGVTPAANPVILDSAGRATIWLSGYYKIVVKDSLDNTISTTDNITAAGASGDMNKSVYDAANIQEQLLGITAVQIVTNKKLSDSTTTIVDNVDNTKQVKFEISGVTTSTTRTITMPDVNFTPAIDPGGNGIIARTAATTSSARTITAANASITVTNGSGVSGNPTIAAKLVQQVNVQVGSTNTTTTIIPFDDTIPQNTEGTAATSLSITPTNSANTLEIDVELFMAHSVAAQGIAALFQDSTASALACGTSKITAGGDVVCISFKYIMTAGTTSSTTFTLRYGGSAAGTATLNGTAGLRILGGVLYSSINIREIA